MHFFFSIVIGEIAADLWTHPTRFSHIITLQWPSIPEPESLCIPALPNCQSTLFLRLNDY